MFLFEKYPIMLEPGAKLVQTRISIVPEGGQIEYHGRHHSIISG